ATSIRYVDAATRQTYVTDAPPHEVAFTADAGEVQRARDADVLVQVEVVQDAVALDQAMKLQKEGRTIVSSTRRDPDERGGEELGSSAGWNDPIAGTHAGELRARIAAALLRLPEAQREVFLLRERGGLELRRIAEVTGANLATVKSRMR